MTMVIFGISFIAVKVAYGWTRYLLVITGLSLFVMAMGYWVGPDRLPDQDCVVGRAGLTC